MKTQLSFFGTFDSDQQSVYFIKKNRRKKSRIHSVLKKIILIITR